MPSLHWRQQRVHTLSYIRIFCFCALKRNSTAYIRNDQVQWTCTPLFLFNPSHFMDVPTVSISCNGNSRTRSIWWRRQLAYSLIMAACFSILPSDHRFFFLVILQWYVRSLDLFIHFQFSHGSSDKSIRFFFYWSFRTDSCHCQHLQSSVSSCFLLVVQYWFWFSFSVI